MADPAGSAPSAARSGGGFRGRGTQGRSTPAGAEEAGTGKAPLSRILLAAALLAPAVLLSPAIQAETAHNNYMLRCMGCHGAQGDLQQAGMPKLQGTVGHFLKVPGGRAYLAQVPGAAHSPLSDDALAAVLNYIVQRYAGASQPAEFRPYTGEEVASYRYAPPANIAATRRVLLKKIRAADPSAHLQELYAQPR